MATVAALLIVVLVAATTFTVAWLVDRRKACARIIEERHTAEEELAAILGNDRVSQIAAIESLVRRSASARVSDLQEMLAQASIAFVWVTSSGSQQSP